MFLYLKNSLIIFLSISSLFLSRCTEQDQADRPSARIVVATAPVVRESLAFPVYTSGLLSSPSEVKLSFKVGGIIDRILVKEGQRVRKNQPLAVLQQSEIEAMVKQARSAHQKALRDFQRVNTLYEDSVATLEQKQDSETALAVAESNLEIAEFNLKHSVIVAPGDGKILKQLAEEHELMGTGQPVFIFGSTEGAWLVRAGITDRDMVTLQYGDTAKLAFDAYPGEKFLATVSELSQAADPFTGTYEVELSLLPHRQPLVFGFVAEIEIHPSRRESFIIIPIEALVEADGGKGWVFYLQMPEKIARKTAIDIRGFYHDRVVVSKGLENVQTLITEGSAYLSDGSLVTVSPTNNH